MDNDDLTQQLLSEFDDYEATNSQVAASIENNNNNQREYEVLEYEWVEGLRAGSKLLWVNSEQSLYCANTHNARYDAMGYTCHYEKCRARVLIKKDGTAIKEHSSAAHLTHGSLYRTYKERRLFVFMKERCKTAPVTATARSIYDEAVLQFVLVFLV